MRRTLKAISLVTMLPLVGPIAAQAEWVSSDEPTPAEAEARPATGSESALFRNTEGVSATSSYERAFSPYEAGGFNVNTDRGGYLRYGGIFVYPSVAIGLGYDDNVLGANTNRTSSTVVTVQPTINAENVSRGDVYNVIYSGNFTKYLGSQADNFNKHKLEFKAQQTYTARLHLDYGLGYEQSVSPRGAFTDGGIRSSPDKWHAPSAYIRLAYGADDARGRAEVESKYFRKTYTNNREFTSLFDYESKLLAERFYWRVMPKTAVLFEARQTWNNYLDSASELDNFEQRYFVGVTWNATAKTTGIAKFGRSIKDFDAGKSTSGGVWEAAVKWSPRTYSTVDFQTKRSIDDPTGEGDYQVNREYSVSWNHKWNSYLASHVNVDLLNTTFGNTSRDDNITTYNAGLSYGLLRWLSLGADAIHSERDSNVSDLDYKRNVLMFTANMTL